jgi:kumamolisin
VFAPNDATGLEDGTRAARLHPKNPCVISKSWGASEDNWDSPSITTYNAEMKACVDAGITIFASAGDNGSTDGSQNPGNHVDFPASSSYAVACGGTFRQVVAGKVVSEVVWNDNSMSSATGGGVSSLFALPDYQKNVVASGTVGRQVPDIAGNADPQSGWIVTNTDGTEGIIGGTSAVSPYMAGMCAAMIAGTGKRFNGPATFYAFSTASFLDVTQGNNGGFAAGVGYDNDTGRGRPVLDLMYSEFQGNAPPVLPPVTPPVQPPIIPPPTTGPTLGAVLTPVDTIFKTIESRDAQLPAFIRKWAVAHDKATNAAVDAAIKKAFGQ